jgi:FixJ family two-component response regulator
MGTRVIQREVIAVSQQQIVYVDNDREIQRAVKGLRRYLPVDVACFSSPQECLDSFNPEHCDLFIADLNTPGMDGLELIQRIKKRAPWLPILAVADQADVPLAVRVAQRGVDDLIEKPWENSCFIDKVRELLRSSMTTHAHLGKRLTESETTVLNHILAGQSTSQIAAELNRAGRTIEFHRQRIMQKLGVRNRVELINRLREMGVD